MSETLYRCPDCGWTGHKHQMHADALPTDDGEWWSNWICPSCGEWWQLSDYEIVRGRDDRAPVVHTAKFPSQSSKK
jgi:predicted RNA-binding Zn-ribbon protein involved in translation (DUF1610 family)